VPGTKDPVLHCHIASSGSTFCGGNIAAASAAAAAAAAQERAVVAPGSMISCAAFLSSTAARCRVVALEPARLLAFGWQV